MYARALILVFAVTACRKVEPAPTELDELTQFFFLEFATGDEERLLEGVDNLEAWHDANGNSAGAMSPLSEAAKAAVGVDAELGNEWLKGVYELVPHTGCSPEDLAAIYAFDDQPSLFPGSYESYDRTYHAETSDYLDGSASEVSWTSHITASIGFKTGTYDYVIEVRRLGALGEESTLVRAYMPEPAQVGDSEDGATFFDQSYTIEVFSPRGSTDVLHHYALWNSGGLKGTSPDSEIWERQYLAGLEDWNDRLDELCADDRGLWD